MAKKKQAPQLEAEAEAKGVLASTGARGVVVILFGEDSGDTTIDIGVGRAVDGSMKDGDILLALEGLKHRIIQRSFGD